MLEKINRDQQKYWDEQHKKREKEHCEMENEPNEFAKNGLKY